MKAIVTVFISTKWHTDNGEQDIIKYSAKNLAEVSRIVENANLSNGFVERIEIEYIME